LRERKKRRTRTDLINAALELCDKQGFEATTVEKICASIEISTRTFNRYFASKEDVVLAFEMEMHEEMLGLLDKQPTDLPIIAVLTNAYVALIENCRDRGDFHRFLQVHRCIEGSSALRARSLERSYLKEHSLGQAVAARIGVTDRADIRPRLAVTVWHSVMRTAVGEWLSHSSRDADELIRVTVGTFALFDEGVDYPSRAADRAGD
jgi:AcrR family transcriptional regulator